MGPLDVELPISHRMCGTEECDNRSVVRALCVREIMINSAYKGYYFEKPFLFPH